MSDPYNPQNAYQQRPAPPPPPPPPSTYDATPISQRAPANAVAAVPPGVRRGRQLLWVALVIVDLFLALHFLFLLTGAGDVGFGHIVYVVGDGLNAPFRGLFNVGVTHSGHPLQWADILAIVIYTAVALIVDRLIVIFTTPSPRRGGPPPAA